ncbi:extracellular solute-binding protein [Maritimibacter sp. HL-12]|uniref:extracellular solute-binding protein n=1 Tax=Maritimibacter sp. HL-12 TaxID=1162418 RepID=UPI000A0F19D1|nr:extracellular solute-binding protein [Maritimibacter sp. HL-12]SMH48118.1 microcin C transport system substrate-binding protein [Maritimibacter sp. HL-12]
MKYHAVSERPRARTASRPIASLGALASLFVLGALALLASTLAARSQETATSHAFSYFGTPKYGPDFSHLDYVNPDAPKGGEIALWTMGTFDSFNPYSRKGVSGWGASINIERLMTSTADEIGVSYCLICETLEYPEDHAWVIFNIRPEAAFADGTPVTAHDVAFTHELFMEQGLPSYREGVARIVEGVEALDEHRVKFTFVADSSKRDRIDQAGATPVMSKAWFEETGAQLDESRLEMALGTGAYVRDSYDINQRIVYRRNPDYWAADLPIMKGRNNFDRIRVEYFADSDAAFEGFKAGAYTFRIENSSKQWATGYDFDLAQNGEVVTAELDDGSQASGQAFVFNLRREKFQDIRVRDAISRMFNFEWSNETLFYELYARITGFASNSYNEATGLPSPEELAILEPLADILPEGVLTDEVVMPPVSGTRQLDRAQLRAASALLDEAGWEVGDDGIRRNAEGERLTVEFLEYSPAFDRVVQPYVANLKALGVDAVHNRVDTAQYVERSRSFDFDMMTDHLSIGYEAGSGLEQAFGSREAEFSLFNPAGISHPAVDALIKIASNSETREDMVAAMRALDRTLRALKFVVPQWFKDTHTVAYYDMFEHPENMPPYDLGYLDFWWFDEEKYEALKASGALR